MTPLAIVFVAGPVILWLLRRRIDRTHQDERAKVSPRVIEPIATSFQGDGPRVIDVATITPGQSGKDFRPNKTKLTRLESTATKEAAEVEADATCQRSEVVGVIELPTTVLQGNTPMGVIVEAALDRSGEAEAGMIGSDSDQRHATCSLTGGREILDSFSNSGLDTKTRRRSRDESQTTVEERGETPTDISPRADELLGATAQSGSYEGDEYAALAGMEVVAATPYVETPLPSPRAEMGSCKRLSPAETEFGPFADVDEATAPSRYRPPQQRQTRRLPLSASAPRSESVLDIRVRLTLDRFGFCQISLLPERKQDMDDEITVKAGAMRLTLAAQEDWYGDIFFDDIGERLRQGIRLGGLLSDGRRVQWQLSGGRDIYVLAGHPSASGFVSVARLALGRTHAVLCANNVLEQAEAILKQAGCSGYTKLDPSHGVPDGWTGLRGVLPETALTLDPGVDPFYALKPAPDIDISLEGGLLLHDAAWLSGYPPQIRVTGQTTGAQKVLIDGTEADAANGCYTAAGFDVPGQHLVECEGLSCSRSYSIEEPAESWEEWAAYAFSGADVCGPLVTLRPEARRNRVFTVPMSNPLLLGAEPGQVFRCSHRNVANWQGFVPFEVVWALPAQPLICDKKTSRILCFSSAPIASANRNARRPLGWCSAILDASRKGLRIEGGSPDSTARWIEYKKAARNIWRGRR